jgi:hypothetical protein
MIPFIQWKTPVRLRYISEGGGDLNSRVEIMSPLGAVAAENHRIAERGVDLQGKRLVLLSNGKPNTDLLLDGLEARMRHQYPLEEIIRVRKGNPAQPCDDAQLRAAKRGDFAIVGVGD